MLPCFIFSAPDGQQYQFKLPTREQIQLVKASGCGIIEGMGKFQTGDYQEFMINLLHISAQKFQHGFTRESAIDLMDLLAENGYDFTKLMKLASDILEASGFFPKELASMVTEAVGEA